MSNWRGKIPKGRSLAEVHPHLAAEWNYKKNGDMTPENVSYGSGIMVWWECSKCSHEWPTKVSQRGGCPECAKEKIIRGGSLADMKPELMDEWDYKKNGNLTPHNVSHGSTLKVWWKCPKCGYSCETRVADKRGCSSCNGKVTTKTNCLAKVRPDLSMQWDFNKNGELTPRDVRPSMKLLVWWLCPICDYGWQSLIYYRSRAKNSDCPRCSGKILTETNCFANVRPEDAKDWHPDKNGDLTPYDFFYSSNKMAWWLCQKCGHEWETKISGKKGCPDCKQRVTTINNCLAYVMPELAKEWNHKRNGGLTPYDFVPGSGKKVWWKCSKKKCEHEWEAMIRRRAKKGRGCPACAGRVATEKNCIAKCRPALARQWNESKNGDLTPHDVTLISTLKVWWQCPDCNHEWESTIADRARKEPYTMCPGCIGQAITDKNNLAAVHPHLLKEWDYEKNGTLKPTQVTARSTVKVWWKCIVCDKSWKAAVFCHQSLGCIKHNMGAANRPSFEEVKKYTRSSEIKSKKEWKKAYWAGLLPEHFVSGPDEAYNDKGWRSWEDFLDGKRKRKLARNTGILNLDATSRILRNINIWVKGKWPYHTAGKQQVTEMLMDQLEDCGYSDLNFLSMPGNGREIKIFDSEFGLNYQECLGVERRRATELRQLILSLFKLGEIGGVIPIIRADIDNVLIDRSYQHGFNFIHQDYNGPLTAKHVVATEHALASNPEAIVAVTVGQNKRGWGLEYDNGQFPFINTDPEEAELMFYQPYKGIRGCPMETYCFKAS